MGHKPRLAPSWKFGGRVAFIRGHRTVAASVVLKLPRFYTMSHRVQPVALPRQRLARCAPTETADPGVQRHPFQPEATRHPEHHRRERGHCAGEGAQPCWNRTRCSLPACRSQAAWPSRSRTKGMMHRLNAVLRRSRSREQGKAAAPSVPPLALPAQGSNFKPTKKPFQFETVLARSIRTIFTGGWVGGGGGGCHGVVPLCGSAQPGFQL